MCKIRKPVKCTNPKQLEARMLIGGKTRVINIPTGITLLRCDCEVSIAICSNYWICEYVYPYYYNKDTDLKTKHDYMMLGNDL